MFIPKAILIELAVMWAASVVIAIFASGRIGYERGLHGEFTGCTVAFSRVKVITELNCDFTSPETADSRWMLKMLTRNNDF